MNIIGVSAFYHDAACCLLQDGLLVAAAQEERFTRIKHDPRLPVDAFRYCLRAGGLDLTDLHAIAYYESPPLKADRQAAFGQAPPCPPDPEAAIRERLGFDGPLLPFPHHQSHAASAFFYSGFEDAALFTADGVGEWATTTYGTGRGATIDLFEEVAFPHSLGLFYATLTAYLGFRVNNGEYKVMGLAPYGQPRYAEALRRLLVPGPAGQFHLDLDYFDFVNGPRMYTPALADLLGAPPRMPDAPLLPFHHDVARSAQVVLEEVLLDKLRYLHRRTGLPRVCLAGGVALNATANGRIRREGPFEDVFIQPAAGDAGGCLGAAALAHVHLTGKRPAQPALAHVALGPAWTPEALADLLAATGLPVLDFRNREADLLATVVDRLVQRQVVGWVQGRMEFGPRALGARSILADPRDPGMRNRLNRMVKQREDFRPFAPSVLAQHAADHFDLAHPAPFMLHTCRVAPALALPAVTHVDGSARPQTVNAATHPRFAGLLEAFYRRTGCPLLLNTSFNVRGEPIVCTPVDALFCMAQAGLDALVLGDFLVEAAALPENWPALFQVWRTSQRSAFDTEGARPNLYTLV